MIEIILSLGVLILPFFIYSSKYEIPKVVFFLSWSLLITVWIFINIFKNRKYEIKKTDSFFLFWLLVLFVSSIVGIHPEISFFGGSYRHQGVVFFLALWMISKYFSKISEKSKTFLIKAIVLSGFVQFVLLIYQKISNTGLLNGRPVGSLGNPNAVAGYLILLLPFVFILTDKEKTLKIITKFLTAVIFLGIALTESRVGLFCFVVIFLLYINNKIKNKNGSVNNVFLPIGVKLKLYTFKTVVILLTAVVVIFFVFMKAETRNFSIFENRSTFTQMAIKNVVKRPVLGYGAESSEQLFNQSFREAEMPLEGMVVERSHNLILDLLMWSGFVGLIAFALWIYQVIKVKLYEKQYYSVFGIIGIFIFAFFQPLGVTHWVFLMILISIKQIYKS